MTYLILHSYSVEGLTNRILYFVTGLVGIIGCAGSVIIGKSSGWSTWVDYGLPEALALDPIIAREANRQIV